LAGRLAAPVATVAVAAVVQVLPAAAEPAEPDDRFQSEAALLYLSDPDT